MTTKIEWVKNEDGSQGRSWNPLRCRTIDGKPNQATGRKSGTGCTMVSPGCLNCYASSMNYRFYGNKYSYTSKPEFFIDEEILSQPLKIAKPTRFFVCSMTDLYHEDVPLEQIGRIYNVILNSPQHTFLILTKRPQRLKSAYCQWPNVWYGVTAENQEMLDQRVPILCDLPVPTKFVSIEPMLGPVTFRWAKWHPIDKTPGSSTNHLDGLRKYIHWVIVGGESGPGARPMHPNWARTIRNECIESQVPFFFKQWGEWGISRIDNHPDGPFNKHLGELMQYEKVCSTDRKNIGKISHYAMPESVVDGHIRMEIMKRVGKRAAGRLLDLVEWNQMPGVTE